MLILFMSAVGLILFISECNRVKTVYWTYMAVADLLHFML